MKINTELFIKYLAPIKRFFNNYGAYLYFALVAAIVGYFMLRVGWLTNYEVTDGDVTSTIKPVSINENQANIILKLNDPGVQITPNINGNRTNPF